MVDNVAECSAAVFESEDFKFEGQVKENSFNGKGKETGKNYTFEGLYHQGQRIEGKLKWIEESEDILGKKEKKFEYTGKFNKDGKF